MNKGGGVSLYQDASGGYETNKKSL